MLSSILALFTLVSAIPIPDNGLQRFGEGVVDGGTNLVEGVGNLVIHPLDSIEKAATGTAHFVTHPIGTIEDKIDSMKEECAIDGARCAGKYAFNLALPIVAPIPTLNFGLAAHAVQATAISTALVNNGDGGRHT